MRATGFQLLFLYFAAIFGSMLATRYAAAAIGLPADYHDSVSTAMTFVIAGIVLIGVPVLRRGAVQMLARPVPAERRKEVALAALLKLAVPFGLVGAIALQAIASGDAGVLSRVTLSADPEAQLAHTLKPVILAFEVCFAWILGPLLEEIYFRGFLYQAWERQWGWMPAAALTSVAFGLGHPSHVVSSFLASLIFIAIMRRTGTLRAPFYAHSAYNMLVFWPLFGHLVYVPRTGEPLAWSTWSVEIACFLVIVVGVPLYLFLARKPLAPSTAAS